jgi:hypothetical protein
MALTDFKEQWPNPRKGTLGLYPPENTLAEQCWDLVTGLFGREGFQLIKSTVRTKEIKSASRPVARQLRKNAEPARHIGDDGLFAALVKAVVHYASNQRPRGEEMNAAIKHAFSRGDALVTRYEADGKDYFAVDWVRSHSSSAVD